MGSNLVWLVFSFLPYPQQLLLSPPTRKVPLPNLNLPMGAGEELYLHKPVFLVDDRGVLNYICYNIFPVGMLDGADGCSWPNLIKKERFPPFEHIER